jgi:hypothetical protein
MQADGVLAPPPMGLVTAFSREQPTKVWLCMWDAQVWGLHPAMSSLALEAQFAPDRCSAATGRRIVMLHCYLLPSSPGVCNPLSS